MVSTWLTSGPAPVGKAWPALWTASFAGDFSLTFIGRPHPGAGQPPALCPSKSFSLMRLRKQKQNKTHPQGNKRRKEKKKEQKCWTFCDSADLSAQQGSLSWLPLCCASRQRPRNQSFRSCFSKSQKTKISFCL